VIAVALETSTRAASAAVAAGELRLERALAGERAHASDLLPSLQALLCEAGAGPREVTAVLVGTGPGSYTGLRVGVATALGIARGAGSSLRGVPSCEALLYAELAPGEVGTFLVDARSGELYVAAYRRVVDELEVLLSPRVATPSELAALLPSSGPIFGDEAAALAARLADDARARLRPNITPRASAVLDLGLRRLETLGPEDPRGVRPLYLRPFAAKVRKR
jgi:tRNA threonylcarbamoyladenosine biosynthesis protein TsaB